MCNLLSDNDLALIPGSEPAREGVTSTTARLREAIPFGRRNAIGRSALARKLGFSDRRTRRAIEEARAEGLIIICECNGRGYYQSRDLDEIYHQYLQDTSRAMAILFPLWKPSLFLGFNHLFIKNSMPSWYRQYGDRQADHTGF